MDIINEGPSLNAHRTQLLNIHFTYDEIKNGMWSIPKSKAPGLDGYNSSFYKAAWEIVGNDIVEAIQHFFDTSVLLKTWNVTAITLISKTARPNDPGDFSPMSCFHVIYKCISKLLCNRLKLVLNDMMDWDFIKAMMIHDHLVFQFVHFPFRQSTCFPWSVV